MSAVAGKVALITGAAGGIGAATARRLHSQGARLVLTDLDEAALASLASEFGQDAAICRCDVTSEADNEAAVQTALDTFGALDIAILNAGTEGRVGLIGESKLADFDLVMAINVRGVFIGLSKVMPAMKAGKGGVVTILSSTAGRRGSAAMAPYITSKHAVVGLMKTAAIEGAEHSIRVNTVNPGPISTRMMDAIEKNFLPGNPQEAHDQLQARIPMGRYGTAEEVANFIAFLSSNDASYCTGNLYGIDGGLTTV